MNDIFNEGRLTGLLPRLRKHLGNTPLIFTFRTTKEGGQRQASPQQYKTLAMEAIASGCIDLIDIELFSDPDSITELTALAKEKGFFPVMTFTPPPPAENSCHGCATWKNWEPILQKSP